jgi:predicted transcriptional regulator
VSLAKDEARRIIDNLPEEATWDDIMYQLYVKEKTDKSLAEIEQGKVLSHEEVRRKIFSKWN